MEVVVLNCWVTDTKVNTLFVELFDDLGEVGQGAGESVNFINDDGVDSLRGNIVQKLFQSWPFHVAAGEAAIVIASGDDMPSLVALAEDVSFARLSLGIQGIERLLQPLLGRFAGIDGAANPSSHGFRTPKNRGPDHRVPVISRAILDRLEYVWPRYS
jgi:hypothetical protein